MNHRTTAPLACSAIVLFSAAASAQGLQPVITDWIINTTGQTGYNGIVANVTQVRYDTTYAYVKSNGIPSYTVGPWAGNPSQATNQNWTFKLTRNPTLASTYTTTGLGQIGVLANGVAFFNPTDAMSWENENTWHQNAFVSVGNGLDACGGHPSPPGTYHVHPRPRCMLTETPTTHSRIAGYAFDSFPVYGPYGYANADGSGSVVRIRTSYRKRTITLRTTLPNGTVLPANLYGPPVSATYPVGYFVEDFEYIAGLGDLDQFNGRVSVTPDYPAGIYCYYSTIDTSLNSEYPYIIGPQYRGVVVAGNTGMGGHNTIPTSAATFCCTPCFADLNGDRLIDGADLASLLSAWGTVGGAGDINRDGAVSGADLTELMSAWGTCP